MIFEISKTFTKLRLIYNQCNPNVTFSEVMILHAMRGRSVTVMELKDFLLKDRAYIIRALSILKRKGVIKEEALSKPKKYSITNLGSEALILLKIINDNLMIEKSITVDELVTKIENHNLNESILKHVKVCYD